MKIIIDILGWSGSGLIILAYALTLLENKKYIKIKPVRTTSKAKGPYLK